MQLITGINSKKKTPEPAQHIWLRGSSLYSLPTKYFGFLISDEKTVAPAPAAAPHENSITDYIFDLYASLDEIFVEQEEFIAPAPAAAPPERSSTSSLAMRIISASVLSLGGLFATPAIACDDWNYCQGDCEQNFQGDPAGQASCSADCNAAYPGNHQMIICYRNPYPGPEPADDSTPPAPAPPCRS